jgi:hypothetical protein
MYHVFYLRFLDSVRNAHIFSYNVRSVTCHHVLRLQLECGELSVVGYLRICCVSSHLADRGGPACWVLGKVLTAL